MFNAVQGYWNGVTAAIHGYWGSPAAAVLTIAEFVGVSSIQESFKGVATETDTACIAVTVEPFNFNQHQVH